MPFEDVIIAGHGSAVQRLPLQAGEEPKSTVRLINEATRVALEMADIDRRQVDALFTHRSPGGDTFNQWSQKLVAELKIAPKSSTAITNHGGGLLSGLKYGALLLERGLANYVLILSGDASPVMLRDLVLQTANIEADLHFEAPYGPITPALYAQFGQRFVYEHGIKEEDLAQVCVDLRANALQHPEATMRSKGPLTVEQVMASPMIASPNRLLHCAPFYKGSRAGAVLLTRAENNINPDGSATYVRALGETVTHEHVIGRFGLGGFGPWKERPNVTVSGAYAAAQQAYEFGGFGPDDVDVVSSSVPFAFHVMMILEDLGLCERGGSAEFVARGGLRAKGGPGSPLILPNGGSLSFGQSAINCIMDALLEGIQQLDGTALGLKAPDATRALVHAHGGVMACNTVALLEKK
ncbi:MAG: acetyl-CoA acetyltransferase [Rhodothermales bacterium]|jgi:acetyl-CoA acetyltransferase